MSALTFDLEAEGPFTPSMPYADARAHWTAYRIAHGYKGGAPILTPPEAEAKFRKTLATGSVIFGLTLAPADASGLEACPWRTPGCTLACVLATGGKGPMASVRKARALRTRYLSEHPHATVSLIAGELGRARDARGPIVARLNVASDIRWEYVAPELLDLEGVSYFDYTKADPIEHRGRHPNYRLTYSVSERARSLGVAEHYLRQGGTAAVVLDVKRHDPLPASWQGRPVVDGDSSDDRTKDPRGVYVGLRAKAAGLHDGTGFVRTLELHLVERQAS